MKTAKLIIGIISICLFFLVAFQSCAAGLGNAIDDNGEASGAAGMILSFCMLIAGIIGIAARNSKGGGITAGVFFLIGGLLGITNVGSFGDLMIWGVVCIGFGIFFLVSSIMMKKTDGGEVSSVK